MLSWITLRRSVASLVLVAVASLWTVGHSTTVSAEVLIPSAESADSLALADVIKAGEELERQDKWADAIQYYEDWLKRRTDSRDIQDRLTRSKIHFDLERRYSDTTFQRSIRKMSMQDALDVYSEVLGKIDTHYVDVPNWAALVQRGMSNFYYALEDRTFLRQHLPDETRQTIDQFRDRVYQKVDFRAIGNRHQARQQVQFIAQLANSDLKIPTTAVVLEFVCGATNALDPYSGFLSSGQLDDVFSQIEGNFVGLGIELKAESDSLLIVSVIDGSPAATGGIVAGDRIIGVAGKRIGQVSGDQAADMLKGPEGSEVAVSVRRESGDVVQLNLQRRRVDVPSVESAQLIDKQQGVGYFRITSFQKTTSRDVDEALWKLYRQGMRFLVMDLRGNPGGLLTASVEVADKFVASGSIVSTRGRSAREDFDYKAHTVGTWRVPLIVLIDSNTASASEIFAGAIRDHQRGRVVGQKSYGKGSVQGIFPLNASKAGVRLTTAKFYSPSGRAISKNGVVPDVVVNTATKISLNEMKALNENADPVLRAGLQLARQQVSHRSN